MALSAKDVIDADVEEERMTCRNGWRSEGVSNERISANVNIFSSWR